MSLEWCSYSKVYVTGQVSVEQNGNKCRGLLGTSQLSTQHHDNKGRSSLGIDKTVSIDIWTLIIYRSLFSGL